MSFTYEEAMRLVFNGHPECGTPDNITVEGCKELARLGKEAWNTWREKHPVKEHYSGEYSNIADFREVDFRSIFIKDFTGFNFGAGARFDHANLSGPKMNDFMLFNGVVFEKDVSFESAHFAGTSFLGACFLGKTSFKSAYFGYEENSFIGAVFLDEVTFDQAEFWSKALFVGTVFGGTALFRRTIFLQDAYFDARTWDELRLEYKYTRFTWDATQELAEAHGLSPNSFEKISFAGACFQGEISFHNRQFHRETNFGRLKTQDRLGFAYKHQDKEGSLRVEFANFVPEFHGCTLHQNTDFKDAYFPNKEGRNQAMLAYMTLKHKFSQAQNVRNEMFFAKLEMREEAARETGMKRFVFRCYQIFSDFGFDVLRPLLFYFWSTIAAAMIYVWIANHSANASDISSWRIVEYTLFNASPLSYVNKRDFGIIELTNAQHFLWALVMTVQKLLSLLFLFLEGLALRNLLKMK